jgi:hypothetical protein
MPPQSWAKSTHRMALPAFSGYAFVKSSISAVFCRQRTTSEIGMTSVSYRRFVSQEPLVIADADPETDRLSAPVVLEGLTAQIFEIAQRWQRLGRMWISFFGIDTSRWAPLRGTLRYFRNRHPGFGTFLEPFLLCWMRRMGPKVFE